MSKKKNNGFNNGIEEIKKTLAPSLHSETKRHIAGIALLGVSLLFILASFAKAGPAGDALYHGLTALFGWGYYLLPALAITVGVFLLLSREERMLSGTLIGSLLLFVTGLGLIELIFETHGGYIGRIVGSLSIPFGKTAAIIIAITLFFVSLLITFNTPFKLRKKEKDAKKKAMEENIFIKEPEAAPIPTEKNSKKGDNEEEETVPKPQDIDELSIIGPSNVLRKNKGALAPPLKDYIFPPLELLKSSVEKPTAGDLRANANIIKRTLESFGVPVDMGEINIGPKVTRYTLKPAEGVKITKIEALNQDLALALAAHPIRIEAPIPGKSLVGIEVPNKQVAIVRLGSLVAYKEFQEGTLLSFIIGRTVSGELLFADIQKMPHLLIAGATGSGKSVMIHSLLLSLLYKNSPETLRMILIDPKRVELTAYEGIPHLITPVITEGKKSIAAFKWTIQEMERRYELLQGAGARDIKSYNKSAEEKLPFIIIIVDELADLMSTFGREIEGFIVRLAQMARATGIHLILATQRPEVSVITGLIKANIPSRIALKTTSQIDSRTILDTQGAEKLLGGGDLLFLSQDFSKPIRVQGAYVSEEEIHAVVNFILDKNPSLPPADLSKKNEGEAGGITEGDLLDSFADDNSDDDDLYEEAKNIVIEAKKASASLLQRRLRVGYARAARLLDILEAKGIIGPGDGAKPREIYWSGDEPKEAQNDANDDALK